MLEIARIFKNRVPHKARLLAFGFAEAADDYTISQSILDGQFRMDILVTPAGTVSVRVVDTDSLEEYALVHAPAVSGAFVGSVIQACEEQLKIIAEHCFEYTVFGSAQAKELIAYAEQAHGDSLEFLWAKFTGNAVLRRKDTGKWYAAMLTVTKAKLGLEGGGTTEVIDLRALPQDIVQLVDGKRYFPGYHMNKTHWYTICLDGSVATQELCARIETSYTLARK